MQISYVFQKYELFILSEGGIYEKCFIDSFN